MLTKLVGKLYAKLMKRAMRKQKKAKMSETDKQRQEVYTQLKVLYSFVRWLNTKGLKNRKQRKTFWKNVVENQPVIENVLQQLIQKHAPKKEVKVLREGMIKKGGVNPKPSTLRPSQPPKGHNPKKEVK